MSTNREMLAYLSLNDREPQRSGERLIEWAKVCRADGVIIPWMAGIGDCLAKRARQATLHCYAALQPGQGPTVGDLDGYYIDTPNEWSLAALQGLGRLVLRVEQPDDVTTYRMHMPDARYVYAHRGGSCEQWYRICQHMLRNGGRLPGYFDDNPGIGHALERAAYAPLIIKRLALSHSVPRDTSILVPYELGELSDVVRGMREQLAVIAGEQAPSPEHANRVPEQSVADIAVVIRSKNEAEWLGRTLEAMVRQRRQPKEIVLVDNESTDATVAIARRFQEKLNVKIVTIKDQEFNFSRALNQGIQQTSARWVISLSAHCIPTTEHWLAAFELETLELAAPFVAGVYGRQEPLEGVTSDFDKRDLWTTFGPERRVQHEDYFFHNANSMVRRSVWERFLFNEQIHGVEDRDWAKKALADGHVIVYAPQASVFHHHGIHHGRNEERAKRVARVIELIQQREAAEAPLP